MLSAAGFLFHRLSPFGHKKPASRVRGGYRVPYQAGDFLVNGPKVIRVIALVRSNRLG
jgi:hypothetical protein